MIESLKEVEALLFEACKLAKEKIDIKDFKYAFSKNFEEVKRDFVEVKENHVFLNKKLFSNNNWD